MREGNKSIVGQRIPLRASPLTIACRMQKKRRAVFLDRDGTLNVDTGYAHTPEQWHWLPGVPEALARFRAQGWLLLVVSNQSGIARGFFDEAALHSLQAWVNTQLAPLNAEVDAWYHCPHLPEISGPCACRKPRAGMLVRAAREWDVDLQASWMIGDRPRDIMAGHAAGCRNVLLQAADAPHNDCALPASTCILPGLPEACEYILGLERNAIENDSRSGGRACPASLGERTPAP